MIGKAGPPGERRQSGSEDKINMGNNEMLQTQKDKCYANILLCEGGESIETERMASRWQGRAQGARQLVFHGDRVSGQER